MRRRWKYAPPPWVTYEAVVNDSGRWLSLLTGEVQPGVAASRRPDAVLLRPWVDPAVAAVELQIGRCGSQGSQVTVVVYGDVSALLDQTRRCVRYRLGTIFGAALREWVDEPRWWPPCAAPNRPGTPMSFEYGLRLMFRTLDGTGVTRDNEVKPMSKASGGRVSVTRRIDAAADQLFAMIADPAQHPSFDGSGMLREGSSNEPIRAVGDVFTMKMHNDEMGDYEMRNDVVEYERNRRIAWEPVMSAASRAEDQADIGNRASHRWG